MKRFFLNQNYFIFLRLNLKVIYLLAEKQLNNELTNFLISNRIIQTKIQFI